MRRRSSRNSGDTSGQLQINWNAPAESASAAAAELSPASVPVEPVQWLPWDFRDTFPQPMPEAIDAGLIADEYTTPERIKAIHDEHAILLLGALHELDAVLDARRRGAYPATGRIPRTDRGRERLRLSLDREPARLEGWWRTLLDTYQEVFGPEAADAFGKALRARHAGIGIETQRPPAPASLEVQPALLSQARRTSPGRVIARLPVPRPLPSAIAAGHFGHNDSGAPIRPGPQEVREITQQHADKLIEILDSIGIASPNAKVGLLESFQTGIIRYAEDFGPRAGEQLEAHVKRQAGLNAGSRRGR